VSPWALSGLGRRADGSGRDALLVKGRMYEVATRHATAPVDDFIDAAARNVMQIHTRPNANGDILVFMPGELASPKGSAGSDGRIRGD